MINYDESPRLALFSVVTARGWLAVEEAHMPNDLSLDGCVGEVEAGSRTIEEVGPARSLASLSSSGGEGITDHDHEMLDLVAEANPHGARKVRVRFQQWVQTLRAPSAVVDGLILAVYEALANVVEHAYLPDHPDPVMHLQARLDHEQLLITVTDHGRWRVPQEPGYGGRGLAMMRSLTTEVHVRTTAEGTTVQLRAAINRSSNGRARVEPPPS
jgi:serine/threonine-protein kinase RsbW